MARIALAIGAAAAGIAVGYATSNPLIGFEVFSAIEGLGSALLPNHTKSIGPRLADQVVSSSANGAPITWGYGAFRIGAQIIWSSRIQETKSTTSQSAKGGPSQSTTTYSYTCSFAAAFCEGPANILRIWGDSKLLYDATSKGAVTSPKLATGIGTHTVVVLPTIYTGTDTQEPDPVIQAALGINATPAFRDLCYVLYENLPLADFGNRVPNIRAECSTGQVDAFVRDTYPPSGVVVDGSANAAGYPYVDPINRDVIAVDLLGATAERIDLATTNTVPLDRWQSSTAYNLGDQILDSNGNVETCSSVTGDRLTGSTEPTWPTSEATVTTDHHVHWTNTGAGPEGIPVTARGALNALKAGSTEVYGTRANLLPCSAGIDTRGFFWNCVAINNSGAPQPWYAVQYDPTTFGYVNRISLNQPVRSFAFARIQGTDYVYFTTGAGGGTGAGSLYLVKAKGGSVVSFASWVPPSDSSATNSSVYPAVDPDTGLVYIVTYHSTSTPYHWFVTVMDPRSGTVQQISSTQFTGDATHGVGMAAMFDPIDNSLIVFTDQGYAHKIDIATMTITVTSAAKVCQGGNGGNSIPGITPAWYRGVVPSIGVIYTIDGSTNILRINHSTLAIETTTPQGSWFASSFPGIQQASYDEITNSLLIGLADGSGGYNAFIHRLYLERQAVEGETLDDVVSDLCERAGLDSDQFDVTALSSITVAGYPITRNADAKSLLTPLVAAYFFDAVESDFILKFVPRGGAAAVDIPEADLGLAADGFELQETIAQEHDLPKQISIVYADPSLDYQQGKQMKARPARIVKTKNQTIIELPLTLQGDEAMAICDKTLRTIWDERNGFDLKLWRPIYILNDPSDVFTFTYNGIPFAARLVKRTLGADLTMQDAAVSENPTNYVSVLKGAPSIYTSPELNPAAPTLFFLLDVPLLEDTDAPPHGSTGYYFAMASASSGWPGGVLYEAPDDSNYTQEGFASDAIIYGVVSDALAAPRSPFTWDFTNTITVRIMNGGSLSSTTVLNVYDGANALILGSEIIQYQNATQNADGSWTLSNLLRGRRGSELSCGTHVTGETAVFLPAGIHRNNLPTSVVGIERFYKAVTIGQSTSGGGTPETLTAADLKPYAVAQLLGTRDVSGNFSIAWIRRTRIGGEWLSGTGSGTVPLSEDAELYDLEVLDGSGNVLRSVLGLTSPTFFYSAAQVLADYGSQVDTCSVRVYQISSQIGRGFPATNTAIASGLPHVGGAADASSLNGIPIVGTPNDGDVLTYDAGSNQWEPQSPKLRRTTIAKTTAALATGASETGSWSIGTKSAVLLNAASTNQSRLQLYSTAAARDADASRPVGTPPTSGSENEVLLDLVLVTSDIPSLSWIASTPVILANGDSSPADTLYYRITNYDGSAAVTWTLAIVPIEN